MMAFKSPNPNPLIFLVHSKTKDFPNLNFESFAKNKQSHSGILRVFFNFAFFLCISPFYITRGPNGKNVASRIKLQMVICAFATTTAILACITDIRKVFPEEGQKWTPVVYFRIFYSVCTLCLTITAWHGLWRKHGRFVDLLDFLNSSKDLPFRTSKISYTKIAVAICVIYSVLGFTSALLGSDLMESSNWTLSYWTRCLILESRYQFFITSEQSNCTRVTLDSTSPTSLDYVTTSFTGIGQFYKFFTVFYWKLFILFGVLSLWLPASAFSKSLKGDVKQLDNDEQEPSQSIQSEAVSHWPKIEAEYLALKDLADYINKSFGAMLFSYTFTSLFYYSINLDAFLLTSDYMIRIRLIVLYLGVVILYIFAADICRQVTYLEVWLSEFASDEQTSPVPFHRLTVILNELSTSSVGVTGLVFTVTYSVVANMTSVLITYFIICVQFRLVNS